MWLGVVSDEVAGAGCNRQRLTLCSKCNRYERGGERERGRERGKERERLTNSDFHFE